MNKLQFVVNLNHTTQKMVLDELSKLDNADGFCECPVDVRKGVWLQSDIPDEQPKSYLHCITCGGLIE